MYVSIMRMLILNFFHPAFPYESEWNSPARIRLSMSTSLYKQRIELRKSIKLEALLDFLLYLKSLHKQLVA